MIAACKENNHRPGYKNFKPMIEIRKSLSGARWKELQREELFIAGDAVADTLYKRTVFGITATCQFGQRRRLRYGDRGLHVIERACRMDTMCEHTEICAAATNGA
jgi:hypothetical protein